jgi:heme A synthase
MDIGIRRQRFTRLVGIAAVLTFLLITVGAITRVTESGMGCGTYWPDCNGRLIPAFETTEEIIEMAHRLFASLVSFYTLFMIFRAWQYFRTEPRIIVPAVATGMLLALQIILGALTVKLSNQWVSVLIHMGNALLLLASFLCTWTAAKWGESIDRDKESLALRLPPVELYLTLILTFLVALVGAAVAGNTATKACVGWPLCDGELWPTQQGPLQVLNMTHRLVVGGLGILLLMILLQIRGSNNHLLRQPILAAFGLYLLQAAVGALVVLIDNRDMLTAVRALHVTFAAATWSALVVASSISWLQQSSAQVTTSRPVTALSGTTYN